VFPAEQNLPESTRSDLDRIRRTLLLSQGRLRAAASMSVVCPSGHVLGWVFDSSAGPVFVARSDRRAVSSGQHLVLQTIDFLCLTTARTWGVGCDHGSWDVCRPWLVAELGAGHQRAVAPKDHPTGEQLIPHPNGDDVEVFDPAMDAVILAAHERCASGIVG
jgi:hypothetical protein